jgi:RNA polymerase sigma factor (sigma-70 family)
MVDDEHSADAEACDADLLNSMAVHPSGSVAAKAAWTTFYSRHKRYLFGICKRAYSRTLDNGQIEGLVQDTFIRAYERAGTYRPPDDSDDTQLRRRRVRAWLARISENIFFDSFRNEPQITLDEDEVAEHPSPDPPKDEAPPPHLIELEQALGQLSEAEQDVLRVTATWYRPGERHQRLPNSVMQQLASSLNTTPDNVRQIRLRALAKLRKIMKVS